MTISLLSSTKAKTFLKIMIGGSNKNDIFTL